MVDGGEATLMFSQSRFATGQRSAAVTVAALNLSLSRGHIDVKEGDFKKRYKYRKKCNAFILKGRTIQFKLFNRHAVFTFTE